MTSNSGGRLSPAFKAMLEERLEQVRERRKEAKKEKTKERGEESPQTGGAA